MAPSTAPHDAPRHDREPTDPDPRLPRIVTVVLPILALVALTISDPQAMRTVATATLGSGRAIAIVIGIVVGTIGISALARGVGLTGWAHTAAVLVPLAVVGGWAIGPYFMEGEELVEDLPVAVAESAPGPEPAGGAIGAEAGARDGDDGEVQPDTSAAADAVDGADTGADPTAGAVGRQELATGTFVGLDSHHAEGAVAAIDLGDGSQVVQLQDIAIQRVPDPVVYLVPTPDAQAPADGSIDLGGLKAEMGTHHYELPAGIDLGAGDWTLLIWCEAFAVPIGGATLA